MGKLVLQLPDGSTLDIPLDRERVTIGRRPDNDVCLPYPAVSGEHAAVVTILDDSFLEDLNSTNGTLVNGRPIAKHFLRTGDEIDIGRQTLVYRAEAGAVGEGAAASNPGPRTGRNPRARQRTGVVPDMSPLSPEDSSAPSSHRMTGSPLREVESGRAESSYSDDEASVERSLRGDEQSAAAGLSAPSPFAPPLGEKPVLEDLSALLGDPDPTHIREARQRRSRMPMEWALPDGIVPARSQVVDTRAAPSLSEAAPASTVTVPSSAGAALPASPPPDEKAVEAERPRVDVVTGPNAGRSAVMAGDELVIGRIDECVVAIRRQDGRFRLVPLEGDTVVTVNGTLVSGEGAELASGDVFELAGARLRFTAPAA